MLHALAPLAVLLVVAPPADVKPGDRCYIGVPTRGAWAMTGVDESAYRDFLLAMRTEDAPLLAFLFDSSRVVARRPGRLVEVLEIIDGDGRPLALNVPAALAKSENQDGTVARLVVPLQYLRPQDAPLPRGEHRLPLFLSRHIATFHPAAGAPVMLTNYGVGHVAAAADVGDLVRYHKAEAARDGRATSALLKSEAVRFVPDWTRAVVVDGRARPLGKNASAIKVRLEGEPLDGKEAWVDVERCDPREADGGARFSLVIRPYKALRRGGR